MSVIVDTSVWADHFRRAEPSLVSLLADNGVRMHAFVIGELAMGNLHDRERTITLFKVLPPAATIDEDEWLEFVAYETLGGSGLGFVDAHLLVSAVSGNHLLWTRDRRLGDQAERLGRRWEP